MVPLAVGRRKSIIQEAENENEPKQRNSNFLLPSSGSKETNSALPVSRRTSFFNNHNNKINSKEPSLDASSTSFEL